VTETQSSPLVYIVDDDDAVRDSLLELLESVEIRAQGFSSAISFLKNYDQSMNGCIVLDIRMPGMSGLELQKKLADLGSILSIIFIQTREIMKTYNTRLKIKIKYVSYGCI
jgi:two-component system response regulator FixJ